MRWQLQDIIIEGTTNDASLAESWQASFASCPAGSGEPALRCHLEVVAQMPPPPHDALQGEQGQLLAYHVDRQQVDAYFPQYGRLLLDLPSGETRGELLPAVTGTYGVLEDVIAMGLSPHLRRRGFFMIHAFAAVQEGRAVLLVGEMGAGKTTTGMALLASGWRLLSNDSPLLAAGGQVHRYPGLLAAYRETFARFAATRHLVHEHTRRAGRQKVTARAEAIWPGIWSETATAGAILFPQIESRREHKVELLSPPDALRRLLPHSLEYWDRTIIPRHMHLLRELVEKTPVYLLRLGPDVDAIPALLDRIVRA